MYAVVNSGGKQYKVQKGQILRVEKIPGDVGNPVTFDRVLMFDIVEHLHPWELHQALLQAHRVLSPQGRLIVHTAPNRWYDQFAYPVVRLARRLMGQGERYSRNPRLLHVAVTQAIVQPTGFLVLPAATLVLLPFGRPPCSASPCVPDASLSKICNCLLIFC